MQSNIEIDFGMEMNQALPEGVGFPGSLMQNLTGLSSALQTALGNINPLLKNTNKDLSQLT